MPAAPPARPPASPLPAVVPPMTPVPRHRHSVAEYLDFERGAATKHEYYDGTIYAMTGATEPHNSILMNAAFALKSRLRGRRSKVYVSDMRLQVEPTGLYAYPDVMALCGDVNLAGDSRDMITNPQVVVEVLSPSTENYDRGGKFEHYRQLASVTDYLLISQDARRVERRARQADGTWQTTLTEGDGVVPLPAIGCELPLDELYEQVELSP